MYHPGDIEDQEIFNQYLSSNHSLVLNETMFLLDDDMNASLGVRLNKEDIIGRYWLNERLVYFFLLNYME